MLNYFDLKLNIEVICDASPYGFSAVLNQYCVKMKIKKRVVAYASRYLAKTEHRYSQIEREASVVLIGCTKLQVYLSEEHFKIMTDHKPLISMFNNPRAQAKS